MVKIRVPRKRSAGVAVPHECPACEANLTDPTLPPEYDHLQHLFSRVMSDGPEWLCPDCGHRWDRWQKG